MRSCGTPSDSVSKRQTFCESCRFTSPLSPPMLRTSTKAASSGLPDIRMAAEPMVTMTYCSGLPIVSAMIVESDASSAFRLSSDRTSVVSSLSNGISNKYELPRRLVKRLMQIGDVKARDGAQSPFARRTLQRAEQGFELRAAQELGEIGRAHV